jgi:hypothetical protein
MDIKKRYKRKKLTKNMAMSMATFCKCKISLSHGICYKITDSSICGDNLLCSYVFYRKIWSFSGYVMAMFLKYDKLISVYEKWSYKIIDKNKYGGFF